MQDFDFVLKGLARLLTNPLTQTYLPNSTKKIQFHQELLVLFWKLCDFNKVNKKPEETKTSIGSSFFFFFSLKLLMETFGFSSRCLSQKCNAQFYFHICVLPVVSYDRWILNIFKQEIKKKEYQSINRLA